MTKTKNKNCITCGNENCLEQSTTKDCLVCLLCGSEQKEDIEKMENINIDYKFAHKQLNEVLNALLPAYNLLRDNPVCNVDDKYFIKLDSSEQLLNAYEGILTAQRKIKLILA